MVLRYLCDSWQGFIQQIVSLAGHGYWLYCQTYYPAKKLEKWLSIDQKLIAKYSCDSGKDKRYRRQLSGQANVIFLRWGNTALLLRSSGILDGADDQFVSIYDRPILVTVSDTLTLKIVANGSKGRATVYLDRSSFREIKAELLLKVSQRHIDAMRIQFDLLNGIPAFSGISQQKAKLLESILKEAKKHRIILKKDDFRINTGRKIHKVFIE
jgi:hypothetical protein